MSMTDKMAINRIASALETIADEGGGSSGGDTVSITPTLEEGTKIADFSINGQQGSLYAPEGGGGSSTWRVLAEMTANFSDTDEDILASLKQMGLIFLDMSLDDFTHTKVLLKHSGSFDGLSIYHADLLSITDGLPYAVYGQSYGSSGIYSGRVSFEVTSTDNPSNPYDVEVGLEHTQIMDNLAVYSNVYPNGQMPLKEGLTLSDPNDVCHLSIVTDLPEST